MKVLITGGTGFIGSRLALRCIATGQAVTVLGQENTAAEKENRDLIERSGAQVVLGSVTDKETVGSVMRGVDVVFHLAAAQHEANISDQKFWDVNVTGTRILLQEADAAGVRRFVHGSTIGVYDTSLSGPIDEDSPLRPDNIYGITKLEAERVVLEFRNQIPVVIIRISETYGPGDRRLLKLFRAIKKRLFFMIGSGENIHQLIYIDDLVEGLVLASTSDQAVGEVVLLAGADRLTTRDMVSTIAGELGVQLRRFRMPFPPVYFAAAVMEKLLPRFGVQPPLHRRRMDFFKKSYVFATGKASKVLGFEPAYDFKEGVARTAAWYAQAGLI